MKSTYFNLQQKWQQTLGEILYKLGVSNNDLRSWPYLLEEITSPGFTSADCYIISGISGSGKTVLGKSLEQHGYHKIPNVVTRQRRPEELDADYIFVKERTFYAWRREGRFLTVRKTNNVWHGFLRDSLKTLDEERKVYLDKSVSSVELLLPHLPAQLKYRLIYILPPSFEILYTRILSRERERGGRGLTETQIFDRFQEELDDLYQSKRLAYTYFVNDRSERVLARVIS